MNDVNQHTGAYSNCMMNSDSPSIDNDQLRGMPLGMGYVPWQEWGKTYPPNEGLACGTIFPCLNLPFFGCIPRGYNNKRGGRV